MNTNDNYRIKIVNRETEKTIKSWFCTYYSSVERIVKREKPTLKANEEIYIWERVFCSNYSQFKLIEVNDQELELKIDSIKCIK